MILYMYVIFSSILMMDWLLNDCRKEGFDRQAIDFRLKRNEMVWMDYGDTSDDDIITIINNSNKDDFHKKFLI